MNRRMRTLAALMAFAVAGVMGVATRTHAQSITTGAISGTITDPAGKKLSGVQISIDSGQMDVTNASGAFTITDILPGAHTVKASLVGYQTIVAENVVVTQDLTTTVNLQFERRETISTGVQTVVAPLIHKNQTPTLYTVTSKEEQLVRSQPNNLYQYPGALISQPGIVPDAQGYPTVRGSKTDEINYMVDGISVTRTSNNGFGSNLVTVGLDRLNVYTGGYRAELGSAIGGVVNAVVKTGASIRGAAVEASTGSWNYTGLVYEQGNVEKNGFNWYVSGNFFRTGFEKNLQIADLPVSADVVAKFVQPVGKRDRVTALLTTGVEHYYYNVNDPRSGQPWAGTYQSIHSERFDEATNSFVPTTPQQDDSPQGYSIGSLTLSHSFTSASNVTLQGYNFKTRGNISALSPWVNEALITHDNLGGGRLDYANQLSSNLSVRFGGEFLDADNYQRLIADPQYGSPDFYNRFRNAGTTDQNAFVSTTWKPSARLTADLGVRYDSRTFHRNITLDEINLGQATTRAADLAVLAKTGYDPKVDITTPRLGATYQLGAKTLLKASGGRYIQMPGSNFIERAWIPANGQGTRADGSSNNTYSRTSRKVFDLQPQTSDGVDVGIEQQLGSRLGLAITPFYRKIQHEVVNGPVYQADGTKLPGGSAYQSIGHGHAKGVETKFEMRESKGLSGWITYTLQSSKNNNPGESAAAAVDTSPGIIDAEHRVDYDQKHTIYVVGQYRKGNFEINPMLELGSGYPWGGQLGDGTDPAGNPDGRYAINPSGASVPILVNGQLQSLDVNPYNTGWHKNLSVTFRLFNDKAKSSFYFVQVQNITNSKDVTSKTIQDPGTGALTGYVPTPVTVNGTNYPGYVTYQTYSIVPPIFVLVGVHKTF